ncbi:cytochrome P450 [Dendrothele bispora CBS 962.96]|uniref:Cytochrome P450 n=1 Tax=Dendrothele bispora (strain CBS 962.96) TaxID=1314807 RepID=A0A4V4HES7_DENBC|nr:cytochrome P450 [Dendrothele bispora CBS 962.96]
MFIASVALLFVLLVGRTRRDPLNKFPGPFIARWTTLYRGYYDLVKKGGWLKHLEVLHRMYGPIVRVGPNELHFNDPRAYGEIYSLGSCFHKDPVLYGSFGNTVDSVFTTPDPQDAAVFRNILAPYLSRRAVIKREHIIRDKVEKLISSLESYGPETGSPANLDHAIPSTALDILTELMFTRSFNMLSVPEFNHLFVRREEPALLNIWLTKYLPDSTTPVFGALTRLVLAHGPFKGVVQAQIKLIREELDRTLEDFDLIQEQIINRENSKATLGRLNTLLRPRRLISEIINLRFAGTDTISNACLVALRYVLTRREVLKRLLQELDDAWTKNSDSDMTYEQLEKLPYLTAVIKESLRLSHGVVSPKGRIVGPGDAILLGETIPAGTVIGISSIFVHWNPRLFPEPKKFDPQRWLNTKPNVDPEVNSEKYLVNFSRGPRSCIGFNLAWCELYLLLGYLFRKLEFVLPEEYDPE